SRSTSSRPPCSREGKSPAFTEAVRPLERWEASQADAMRPLIDDAKAEHALLEARAKKLREKAAGAMDTDQQRTLAEAARSAARAVVEHKVPAFPRLIVDDCPPERLGALLAEQGGRLALMSQEGGVFEILAGRYSANGAPNLDVFLKGHSGDTLRVDRT